MFNENNYNLEAEAQYRHQKYQEEARHANLAKQAEEEQEKLNLKQSLGFSLISIGQKLVGEFPK